MHDLLTDNHKAYAKRLASYITDPSTVRAHTIREFGRGPSLALAEDYIASAQAAKKGHDYGPAIAAPIFVPAPIPQPVIFRPTVMPLTAAGVITQVAELFGFTYEEMRSDWRNNVIVRVRYLTAQLLLARGHARSEASGMTETISLSLIGRWMGRDHSTICHALNRFNNMRERTDLAALEVVNTYSEFLEEWDIPDFIYVPAAKRGSYSLRT